MKILPRRTANASKKFGCPNDTDAVGRGPSGSYREVMALQTESRMDNGVGIEIGVKEKRTVWYYDARSSAQVAALC